MLASRMTKNDGEPTVYGVLKCTPEYMTVELLANSRIALNVLI